MTTTASTTAPTPGVPRRLTHIIDGRERPAEDTLTRHAPGTGRLVTELAAGTAEDVDAAVRAARAAFDSGPWPRTTAVERNTVLLELADLIEAHAAELATMDAEEAGKPIRLAEADIAGAATLCRYAAGLAMQLSGSAFTSHGDDFTGLVLREPIGVAGLIVPWNFPALILCQKLPFALAAGCTVVIKPSEMTSSSAVRIVQLALEAGVPQGAVNLVTGDGRAGQALAEHPDVDLLSFTGSTATGRKVIHASAGTIKKLSLELGGKAANIVFADADLEDAVDGVVHGAFFNNGECCVSQPRLLVHEDIADDFVQEVIEASRRLHVGQPLDRHTDIGALISQAHVDKVLGYVRAGLDQGAELRLGGTRLTGLDYDQGLFVGTTVLDAVSQKMSPFAEEIFGPVLTVTRFSTPQEAIALANVVEYGLANSIWSKNTDTVLSAARALRSGTVYVNTVIDAPPQMPFGGYKASGVGREMGQAGLEEFTELKSVNIRTGKRAGSFALGRR